MVDLSKLNRQELKELLKKLKLLSSLKKTLGNRGISEYRKVIKGIDSYKVEYYDFDNNSIDFIHEKALEGFDKLFGLKLKKDVIQFALNKDLKGGMRIFVNDNMFDLSFSRFEKVLN